MVTFTVAEAQLVSLFLASTFYGIFFATFCDCLRALIWNGNSFKASISVKWRLLIVACLMFVCLTVDAIIGLEHNLDAFIRFNGPPEVRLRKIDDWTIIARVCCCRSAKAISSEMASDCKGHHFFAFHTPE